MNRKQLRVAVILAAALEVRIVHRYAVVTHALGELEGRLLRAQARRGARIGGVRLGAVRRGDAVIGRRGAGAQRQRERQAEDGESGSHDVPP